MDNEFERKLERKGGSVVWVIQVSVSASSGTADCEAKAVMKSALLTVGW